MVYRLFALGVAIYMRSMYHQLHSLKKIQSALSKLQSCPSLAEESRSSIDGHIEHCFNYLRQGVICAGVLTLEGPDIADGKNRKSTPWLEYIALLCTLGQ
jgi:hypothetical protein